VAALPQGAGAGTGIARPQVSGQAGTMPHMPHVRQLDGFRAMAILIVFFAHCGLERIVPGGFGVTIFFFLSGYLITSLLRSEYGQTGRISLSAFYWRRTLRIWPPLYITLAVCWTAMLVFFPGVRVDPWGVVAQIAFVNNYAYLWGHGSGLDLPLWSLAVEEHFYLIFPAAYALAIARLSSRGAFLVCAFSCLLVLLVRVSYVAAEGPIGIIYYWSHTRIDSILFGCCLALYNNPVLDRDAWRPHWSAALAAIGLLLFCLLFRNDIFRQTLRYSLQGMALYVLFAFALHDRGVLARILSSPPLRLISLYSYTFYLVHVMLIRICTDYFHIVSLVPLVLIAGTSSMLYCALMYHFVERPLAQRRRRLHKADSEATEA
jgi:peptidoglycan/LPS O-acetylase OafA/YrhL